MANKFLSILTLVVALAGVGLGGLSLKQALKTRNDVEPLSQRMAAVAAPTRPTQPVTPLTHVYALGRILPEGGVVDLAGQAGDRVGEFLPDIVEGAQVKAEQELVRLQSYDLRAAELQAAEVQLADAQAQLEKEAAYGAALLAEADLAVREQELLELDIAATEAKLALAHANAAAAQADLDRLQALDVSLVAPQQLDQQQLRVQQAQAEVLAAQTALDKLAASLELAAEQAAAKRRTAQAEQARAEAAVHMGSLQQAVLLAQARLQAAILRAPCAGRILEILLQEGEAIAQQPVLRLACAGPIFVRTEVYETDIARVAVGQAATIASDVLGAATLAGQVVSIGSTVGKGDIVALDPTASADARTVRVLVKLDDKSSDAAENLINLQVYVSLAAPQPAAPSSAAQR